MEEPIEVWEFLNSRTGMALRAFELGRIKKRRRELDALLQELDEREQILRAALDDGHNMDTGDPESGSGI